jgi:hypothetical protein
MLDVDGTVVLVASFANFYAGVLKGTISIWLDVVVLLFLGVVEVVAGIFLVSSLLLQTSVLSYGVSKVLYRFAAVVGTGGLLMEVLLGARFILLERAYLREADLRETGHPIHMGVWACVVILAAFSAPSLVILSVVLSRFTWDLRFLRTIDLVQAESYSISAVLCLLGLVLISISWLLVLPTVLTGRARGSVMSLGGLGILGGLCGGSLIGLAGLTCDADSAPGFALIGCSLIPSLAASIVVFARNFRYLREGKDVAWTIDSPQSLSFSTA